MHLYGEDQSKTQAWLEMPTLQLFWKICVTREDGVEEIGEIGVGGMSRSFLVGVSAVLLLLQ